MIEPDADYWRKLAAEQDRALAGCTDMLRRVAEPRIVGYWRKRIAALTAIRDFANWQAEQTKGNGQ